MISFEDQVKALLRYRDRPYQTPKRTYRQLWGKRLS
jgi:ribosomal protein L20